MNRFFTRYLFFLTIFILVSVTGAFAQTLTVRTFLDPGPYGRGSSISVPININDAGGCINQNNTFNLVLSDATGNFTPGTIIGSTTGFYTPFVNGVIPAGTPAGAGYKVRVQSTSPATTSASSAAFSISAAAGVTPAITSSSITTGDPDILVRCIGSANAPFVLNNNSAPGTTVTANFINEQTVASEGTFPITAGAFTFTAQTSNYNVIIKGVNTITGAVGTFSYQLVNNLIRNNIGSTGNGFVCLTGGQGTLSFNIDVTSLAAGIQVNYPGNTYQLDWGDGTSNTFTFCQLKALNGVVSHIFTLPSCGQTGNGVANSFFVQNKAISPFCGQVSAPPGVSAKVLVTPVTKFDAPASACVGTALTIPNTSDPGPDPNATTSTCAANPGALYDWSFDGGAIVVTGVPLNQPFIIPATTTPGIHTLTLHSEFVPGSVGCPSADYTQTICFENPPAPVFSIPHNICITSGPVTPTNTSTIDATCGVDTYSWIVTGPGAVTFAGGTNATSAQPQFVFPVSGTYTVQLGINSGGCGLVLAAAQTITVDSGPGASLSPNVTICGNNLTLTFDPNQTVTKTILTGTAQTQPTTYTWTITGGTFTFLNGTNSHSKFPKILFADFATYTVQVTHQNACGTTTKTQLITFVQSPTVDAGPDQTVCASSPVVSLSGSITGSFTSFHWVGGTGTFSAGRNSLNTDYTPSNAEITAGTVTLTFQVLTALPAPCNIVNDDIVITVIPTAFITSPPTATICSGQPLNYTITSNSSATTYAWTASLTAGTATGFTATGSTSNINDVLINTGTVDAVITYHIVPTIGACPGTPFDLTVTVHAIPVSTATPGSPNICNDQPVNVALTSNITNTTYTWTSSATAGLTGNTNQSTPLSIAGIQDIIHNSGTTTAGTVTYSITPFNGSCPGNPVTTTVTIEPSPPVANAGPGFSICNETVITLTGNNPGSFAGLWTQTAGPPVTIVSPSNAQTQVTGLTRGNIYTFKWTIFGLGVCPSTESLITISAFADVIPSFTMNQTHACGTLTVDFTNTSTPAPSGTFVWDFGDGSPTVTAVTPPQHTFLASTNGTNRTYRITLTPTSNCGAQTPYFADVTVSPQTPLVAILPNQTSACGTFTLTVQNLSPGENSRYDFYLKDHDGNIMQHLTYTNKGNAVFQPVTPTSVTSYTVYGVVTDQCGNTAQSTPQIISVSPSTIISQIQIKGDVHNVCLGSPITFQNLSTGGDRFVVTLYDSQHHVILTLAAGAGDLNYTPTAIGIYYVTITAGNDGCGDAAASAEKQFRVFATPEPDFTFTADKNYNVTFNNTTPGVGEVPASSIIYEWDFGDGSPVETAYIPGTHQFDFAKSPFTITLKATTPGASCLALVKKTLNVKFTGDVFLPNAFMPAGSNSELRVFKAKGTGLKTWRMQIFNNFGQLIWESTKLDNNGSPLEGWDGTYKGQIVEQGVYIWQITATLMNGEEWRGMSFGNSAPSRTGAIHLIR